jgi:hypothetical protein
VNRDDPMTQLMEAAVPDLPRGLQVPPLARIRRTAQRRRAITVGGTALAAVLIVSAGLLTYGTRSPAARQDTLLGGVPAGTTAPIPTVPVPAPSPGPALGGAVGQSPDGRVPWLMGQLDRAGTALTVYVPAPTALCYFYPYPVASAAAPVRPGGPVVVTVTARPAVHDLACHESPELTPLPVTLAEPLGTGAVDDGFDRTARIVFRDTELPLVPPPWTVVGVQYGPTQEAMSVSDFTRPGGPDIHITARVGALPTKPVKPIKLGIRPGAIYHDTARYSAQWNVGDLAYQLTLQPTEGAPPASMADLLSILSKLTWSQ